MTGLTLYEISADFAAMLDSAFDEETGEALPIFDEQRALFASKSNAVGAFILNSESTLDAMVAHVKAVQARMRVQQAKIDWLRCYLSSNMALSGITEIKAGDGTFSIKLYLARDESVELDDGAVFPPELCAEPKPPLPSRTKIKEAILAGQPISGARIVRRDRLTIK